MKKFGFEESARRRRSVDNDSKNQSEEEKKEEKEWRKFMNEERKIYRQLKKKEQKLVIEAERMNTRRRREWKQNNKGLIKFYKSIEKAYNSICTDLNLMDGLTHPKKFKPNFPSIKPPRFLSLANFQDCITVTSTGIKCVPKTRPAACSSEEHQLTYKKLSTGFYDLDFCEEEPERVCKIDSSMPKLTIKTLTGSGDRDDTNDDKFFSLVRPESVVQDCLMYDGSSIFDKIVEMDRSNHDDFENNAIDLFEYNWPEVDINCLKDINEIRIIDHSGNGWRAEWLHVIVNDVDDCTTTTYGFDGFWVEGQNGFADVVTKETQTKDVVDQWETS